MKLTRLVTVALLLMGGVSTGHAYTYATTCTSPQSGCAHTQAAFDAAQWFMKYPMVVAQTPAITAPTYKCPASVASFRQDPTTGTIFCYIADGTSIDPLLDVPGSINVTLNATQTSPEFVTQQTSLTAEQTTLMALTDGSGSKVIYVYAVPSTLATTTTTTTTTTTAALPPVTMALTPYGTIDPAIAEIVRADLMAGVVCAATEASCRMTKLITELNKLGLYGTQAGYIQKVNQCDSSSPSTLDCPGGAAIDKSQFYVVFTLATEDSYVAAKGTPDLATAKSYYMVIKTMTAAIVGVNNVFELAPVVLAQYQDVQQNAKGAGTSGNDNNSLAPQTFQSKIFTLTTQFMPFASCSAPAVIHKDALHQLVLINGKNGMMMFYEPDSDRTRFCRATTEEQIANGDDPCKHDVVTLDGKDGKTTHIIMEDNVITGNIAAFADDVMQQSKSYMEALQLTIGSKTIPSCDEIKKTMEGTVAAGKVSTFTLPGMDTIPYNGQQVKTAGKSKIAIEGHRAFVMDSDEATKFAIPVVTVYTIGATEKDSALNFHPIADPAPFDKAAIVDMTVTAIDDQQATIALFLSKDFEGKALSSLTCRVAMTGEAPAVCDPPLTISMTDAPAVTGFAKTLTHAKVGQEGRRAGLAAFGDHFGSFIEKNVTDMNGLTPFQKPVFSGYEDQGKNQNAIVVDKSGSHFYREDDKGVAQDPYEIYPGFDTCAPVNQPYGGTGNLCFSDMLMTRLININQSPVINTLTATPVLEGGKAKLSADVRKETGEVLKNHWILLDGQGNDVSHLLDNPDADSPTLNLALPLMTMQPIKVAQGGIGAAPDVTLNAAISTIKSVGAKAEGDVSQPAYIVVLKTTDAGGLNDVAIGKIAQKDANVAKVQDATVGSSAVDSSLANFYGVEGGCSVLPNSPSSNVIWILLIPAFMARLLRSAYRRW